MIIMIDDEKYRMVHVYDMLEMSGYSVKLVDNVDDALDVIKKDKNKIKAIILDIMMPWGNVFKAEDTKYGTQTGYKFFFMIREIIGEKIPIIIYTAYKGGDILNDLKQEKNSVVRSKADTSAKDILKLLKDYMR